MDDAAPNLRLDDRKLRGVPTYALNDSIDFAWNSASSPGRACV